MAELIEGHELACTKLLGSFLDCGNLLGRSFFFRELCDSPFQVADSGIADVVAKRLPHELGARPVFFLANTLELFRHLRRQGYGKRS